MKKTSIVLLVGLSAFAGALLGMVFAVRYMTIFETPYDSIQERQQLVLSSYSSDSAAYSLPPGLNFEAAAQKTTPAVVHIRTSYSRGEFSLNPLELTFRPRARSSGSGVIISDDGFVVTNYHVIEDANNIEIVMNNNQRFFAKVIGTDPSTDLALLKINGRNLPFVRYGESDKVVPGEWVLAIGNPFDLNSTVTAGIVSAKARNIGILRDRNNLQIESFIQTDAAINPGNSGGALINLEGELVGINSAIATATGSYNGYSFAIPVSLVRKIMDDLLEYGKVQRGLLGVRIMDVTAELSEDQDLPVVRGVYVSLVNPGSGAEDSGILSGDVILAIDGHDVYSVSELQEWVARNRPGETVEVTFLRNGKEEHAEVVLKSYSGSETMVPEEISYTLEGATVEDLTERELRRLQLEGGVRVQRLRPGKWSEAGIPEGFIITHLDKVPVENVRDLNRILNIKEGGVLVEGLDESLDRRAFALSW